MEDIKFRGWLIDQKRMFSWEELLKRENSELLFSFFGNEFWTINPPKNVWVRMQFTGIVDKNGIDVYAGDIVRHGDSVQQVYWDNYSSGFKAKPAAGLADIIKPLEVIGNIYENPELLKTGA